jgi:hypothetical protein
MLREENMLRTWLLATTILMIAGSVSFSRGEAGEKSAGQPRGIAMSAAGGADNRASALQTRLEFGNPGRDRNRDFLCTYGYEVYYSKHCFSGSCHGQSQHYAVPIRGKGKSVTEIIVTDSPVSGSPSFNVGIYENMKGKPGTPIASGTGQALGSCIRNKVVIPKTFLVAGKKYWVEERTTRPTRQGINAVSWGYNPNARHDALYQHYSYFSSSGTLSEWLPVSGPAPFAKVQ